MPKPIAYIETTVPNFYYDFRPDPAIVARRAWTREWWASARDHYEMKTSEAVIWELAAGTSARAVLRVALLESIPLLRVTADVTETAQIYVRNKVMPADPYGDALHLALASHHHCDFIVTWNYKHLANPNKSVHIRRLNDRLGLSVPEIVTPRELLERT